MGQRGRAPKPTKLRILHGDRADRINRNEPRPPNRPISPPAWLTGKARERFEQMAPELREKAGVSVWDADTFAILCDLVERYSDSKTTDSAAARLAPQIRQYAREFGLTPASRVGLHVSPIGRDALDDLSPSRLLS